MHKHIQIWKSALIHIQSKLVGVLQVVHQRKTNKNQQANRGGGKKLGVSWTFLRHNSFQRIFHRCHLLEAIYSLGHFSITHGSVIQTIWIDLTSGYLQIFYLHDTFLSNLVVIRVLNFLYQSKLSMPGFYISHTNYTLANRACSTPTTLRSLICTASSLFVSVSGNSFLWLTRNAANVTIR